MFPQLSAVIPGPLTGHRDTATQRRRDRPGQGGREPVARAARPNGDPLAYGSSELGTARLVTPISWRRPFAALPTKENEHE